PAVLIRHHRQRIVEHLGHEIWLGHAAALQVLRCHGNAYIPSPDTSALRRASVAFSPTAKSVVPFDGLFPSEPSGRMNRIFFETCSNASECLNAICHHGALVRSGVSAIPFPLAKNLHSHGSSELRPPKGGFIQTNPDQARS